jgi:hypothetical protein
MIPPSSEKSDLTAFALFNARLYDILSRTADSRFHIEFVNLCAFYSKVNETNVGILKNLSTCMQTLAKNDAYSVNTTINSFNWDKEDDQLYCFMTSFTNL